MRNALRFAVALATVAALLGLAGCGKRRGGIVRESFVDAQALYDEARESLERRDLLKAKKAFERIQFGRENRIELEPLVRLSLADIAFYQGTEIAYIDARSMYLDFVTLYADHEFAPYAQLQSGICSLKQANHPTRDQSETLQAIRDLREVVTRYPNSPYAAAARDVIRQAQGTLAEHEYAVGRFYLKRKAYDSAVVRFRKVVDDFPNYTDKDKIYFHLGKALIRRGDATEGRSYLDRVVADYPHGTWAKPASQLLADAEAAE